MALLVAGNIKAIGTPKEVLQPKLIEEAYCLPVQVIKHPFLDIPLVLPDKNNPQITKDL
jgi:ABC-type hemin transport system ATPase subunit